MTKNATNITSLTRNPPPPPQKKIYFIYENSEKCHMKANQKSYTCTKNIRTPKESRMIELTLYKIL